MWDITIHPPSGPSVLTSTPPCVLTLIRETASSLTHSLVSGSDTICNDLRPPLTDTVLFGFSLSGFKTCLLGKMFPHPYKWCFVLLPTNVGYHNPPASGPNVLSPIEVGPHQIHSLRGPVCLVSTPLWGHPPHGHIVRCLALIPFVMAQFHR